MSSTTTQEPDISAWKERDSAFVATHSNEQTSQNFRFSLGQISAESGWYQMASSGVPAGRIHDLHIKKEGQILQYGDFATMEKRLHEFFIITTNMDEEKRDECITHMKRLVSSFIAAAGEESGYMIVRTHKPKETEESFEPRWHFDGGYLKEGPEFKLVIAMNGRGTLVSAPNAKQRAEIVRLDEIITQLERGGKEKECKEWMRKLDKFMETVNTEYATNCEKLAIYQVLGPENGLLHSEPVFDIPRIFMSVVPGPVKGLSRLALETRPRLLHNRWLLLTR